MSGRIRLECIARDEPDAALIASARRSSGDLVVSRAEEYLPARQRICAWLASSDSNGVLRVLLVGKRYRMWCDDLLRIGVVGAVESVQVGRRAEAEKAWGISLPDELSTQELMALLGEEALAPLTQGGNYIDHLLEKSAGEAWTVEPSPHHLARIVASLVRSRTGSPWLQEQQRERLLAWAEETANPLSSLYRALHGAPGEVAKSIGMWWASRNLADDVRLLIAQDQHVEGGHLQVLRQAEGLFRKLGAEALPVLREIDEHGLRAISAPLEDYWHGTLVEVVKASELELGDLLGALPLVSPEELRALASLRTLLASLKGDVLPETAERVEELASGEEALRPLVDTIRSRVRPSPPLHPEPAWSEAKTLAPWEDWLDIYLPFRHAAERAQLSREEWKALEEGAVAFGDWYVSRYPALLRQKGTTLLDVGQRVQELLGEGERVLWVVWDNLPYVFAGRVGSVLAKHGLYLHRSQKRLAMLPSVTKVSCAALLAGTLGSKSGNDGYRASLKARYGDLYFINRLSTKELVASQASLAVLHFTQFDSLLHKAEHEHEESREADVLESIDRFAKAIAEAFEAFRGRGGATLVLSTDHGSTRLPPDYARTYPLPPDAQEIDAMGSRAVLTPEPVPYDRELAYALGAPETGLAGVTYMPRGFASWKTIRQGSGSVHGGPLPEEVVVPVMEFSTVPLTHQPLQVRLGESELRAGVEQNLVILVRNPSASRVTFRVQAASGTLVLAETGTLALSADREKPVELPLHLPAEFGGQTIPLRIQVLADGQNPVHAEYRVQVLGGALRSESADDLFDFG